MKKVQTQLLVNPITRQRADALAVVMGEPRAEILRRAIEGGGLKHMEMELMDPMRELFDLAARLKNEPILEFAERVARDGFTLADLREMTEYPQPEQG